MIDEQNPNHSGRRKGIGIWIVLVLVSGCGKTDLVEVDNQPELLTDNRNKELLDHLNSENAWFHARRKSTVWWVKKVTDPESETAVVDFDEYDSPPRRVRAGDMIIRMPGQGGAKTELIEIARTPEDWESLLSYQLAEGPLRSHPLQRKMVPTDEVDQDGFRKYVDATAGTDVFAAWAADFSFHSRDHGEVRLSNRPHVILKLYEFRDEDYPPEDALWLVTPLCYNLFYERVESSDESGALEGIRQPAHKVRAGQP